LIVLSAIERRGRAVDVPLGGFMAMATFEKRDLHLVKKALCLSVLVIERQAEGPFRPDSDITDLKDLADRLFSGDAEFSHYMRSAHLILNGGPV
jgi:hypothetical protein